MFLKLISSFNEGIDSIDCHWLYGNVTDFHIYDVWVTQQDINNNYVGIVKLPGIETIAYPNKVHGPQVNTHNLNNDTCHQVFVVSFKSEGKDYSYITNMPIYVMNDNGKTVQSYNPISK